MRIVLLLIVGLCLNALASQQKNEIRFGVFAYLGKEQTYDKYKHLENYLNGVLKQKVVIEVLSAEEIEEKISNKELDIVTTNPTHFLLIRHKFALSGALATLISKNEYGVLSSQLGGVMIATTHSKINTVYDIKDKKVATLGIKNMGGFRSQAYELKKYGIDVLNTKNIVEIKTSHQDVVKAILENKADVGFIRDGILELMIANETLSMDDIKILNPQSSGVHPYIVSTELYPEWPVFALPYTDKEIIKNIISALYAIEPSMEVSKLSGIGGYTLPADYLKVEKLARSLKLPPFDHIDEIGYKDIWQKYKFDILVTIFALLVVIAYYVRDYKRKDFLNSLLINIGDGVYGVDKDGSCVWINKSALDMLGYTKKDVLYKNQHFLFHHHKLSGEDYKECECPIHQTVKDGKKRECTEYFIRQDGSFFPVFLSVSSYSKKGGAIVVFRDITLLKQQEDELSKKNDKLKLTIESSHIGIWEWDLVKDLIVFDKNIFDILEYDKEFLLNRQSFFAMVHANDLFRIKGVFHSELIFSDEFKVEIRVERKDKSYAWIEVRGKIIHKDKNGDPIQLIGTFNDITHIKEYEEILENEVRQKTNELEKINQNLEFMIAQEVEKNRQKDILLQQQSRLAALGEMIGNIAHQWRQPLSAITAAISGLKLKFDLGIMEPCDVEEINNHVMQNARFLSSTIENFRNFFKQDMEKKTFVVSDVLEDSIKIIKAAYDSNFIKIEKQIDKTVHYYGSDNMLSQVVLNILSNAKDAFNNQSNNVDKEVFVLLYRDGDDIFIKIKDNAGGISDEIKDKIFDPYFTTKHQSQGTGLGLYMSTQIIRNHFGGDIKVDNVGEETKKGASFEISFPFFEDENTKRVINE